MSSTAKICAQPGTDVIEEPPASSSVSAPLANNTVVDQPTERTLVSSSPKKVAADLLPAVKMCARRSSAGNGRLESVDSGALTGEDDRVAMVLNIPIQLSGNTSTQSSFSEIDDLFAPPRVHLAPMPRATNTDAQSAFVFYSREEVSRLIANPSPAHLFQVSAFSPFFWTPNNSKSVLNSNFRG
ncbi:hypothetical protein L596_001973 [Steinernema carpocapsae]|uniref:Uncharacterized protein n=1 Tax=Steinernema carpocapsae TaxID=34508 RepID=A0A4U8UMN8_STECR|nr:hypothetical protein L596_001973 [Steinernema carpocapsae]